MTLFVSPKSHLGYNHYLIIPLLLLSGKLLTKSPTDSLPENTWPYFWPLSCWTLTLPEFKPLMWYLLHSQIKKNIMTKVTSICLWRLEIGVCSNFIKAIWFFFYQGNEETNPAVHRPLPNCRKGRSTSFQAWYTGWLENPPCFLFSSTWVSSRPNQESVLVPLSIATSFSFCPWYHWQV